MFAKLGIKVSFRSPDKPLKELHPRKTAEMIYEGETIGCLGRSTLSLRKRKIWTRFMFPELRLAPILGRTAQPVKFEEYSKVPSVERDIAIVVPKDLPVGDVISELENLKNTLLSKITVFDIYTGEKIGSEEKSIAINLEFSATQTLSDELVNQKLKMILKHLKEKFNASLRG